MVACSETIRVQAERGTQGAAPETESPISEQKRQHLPGICAIVSVLL